MKLQLKNTKYWVLLSLTLGLAPFFPEPHIWGKLKWLAGGAIGMEFMDWFDVVLHGTPWVLLIISLVYQFSSKMKKN
ncbi:MAG: hypothetical protein OEW67_06180 [Cyclobacteriaceae bacterium]|nr:hypothetical protein [Cyclobacteriaceae bacterium]